MKKGREPVSYQEWLEKLDTYREAMRVFVIGM